MHAGPSVAIGAGYAVTEHIELGATAQTAGSVELFGDSIRYTSVTGGCRYYLLGRARPVRPWLIVQTGWYRADSTSFRLFGGTRTRADNAAGVNLGGGFDVPIGKLVSLGLDVRYHQTFGVFDDPGFVTTMANVAFHFGS